MSPQTVARSVKHVRNALALSQKMYADSVGTSPSSVARWEKRLVQINSDTADKVILFDDVVRAALDFMDKDEAIEWFQTKNAALGGKRPLDLADRISGLERVNQVLVSLEWGLV